MGSGASPALGSGTVPDPGLAIWHSMSLSGPQTPKDGMRKTNMHSVLPGTESMFKKYEFSSYLPFLVFLAPKPGSTLVTSEDSLLVQNLSSELK